MNGHVRARVTDWIGKDFNSSQRDIPAGQQVWVEDGALATHGEVAAYDREGRLLYWLPGGSLTYAGCSSNVASTASTSRSSASVRKPGM